MEGFLKYTTLKVNSGNLDSLKILVLVLGYFKKFLGLERWLSG